MQLPPAEKTYTPEEQQKLLEGYILLEPRFWPHLKAGDQIRYYLKDGKFRVGGRVVTPQFYFKKNLEREGPGHIMMCAETNPDIKWSAQWDSIAHIYTRPSIAQMVAQEKIKEALEVMNANTQKIAARLKELGGQVKELGAQVRALQQAPR